jgi:hypothetical protein
VTGVALPKPVADNSIRRGFASYHLAKHRDASRLALTIDPVPRTTSSSCESVEQQSSTQTKSSKRIEYCENNAGELLKRLYRAPKQRSHPDKV